MTAPGIAVIGAGMIGAAHAADYRQYAPRFGAERFRLATVCDMNGKMAADWGFAATASDWREVVADPEIGTISVCLPNFLHAEVTQAALEAGKNVLCEKPLALSAEAAGKLALAAANAPGVSGTVFNYRRIPAMADIKRRLDAGELGRPVQITVSFQCDYAADPLLPHSWRYEFAKAGPGALLDIGTHAADMARFLFGEVAEVVGAVATISIPERRLPLGATTGHGHVELSDETAKVDNDDVMSGLLRFANGAQGFVSASRVAVGSGNCMTVEVLGTKGTARYSTALPSHYELATLPDTGPAEFRKIPNRPASPAIGRLAPVPHDNVAIGYAEIFGYMIHEFLAAIHEGRKLENGTIEDGWRIAQILDAIQAASVSNAPVKIA